MVAPMERTKKQHRLSGQSKKERCCKIN